MVRQIIYFCAAKQAATLKAHVSNNYFVSYIACILFLLLSFSNNGSTSRIQTYWSIICRHYVLCCSDLLRLSLDEMAMQQKKEDDEVRRELAQDLVQYRAINQRAEDSRDADINYSRQAAPDAIISVSDSALGPASMQVFLVSIACSVLVGTHQQIKSLTNDMDTKP